jgi:acyl-CoA thioesterase I
MNVFFFGDSICFGEKVSPHLGWVTRIAAAVDAEYGQRVFVANSSVNGDTTRMALERMPFAVQRYGVDLLVVQFGMNDANYWDTDRGVPRVSPAAFEANLREIVARGVNFGARRVVLNTNHPSGRTHTPLASGLPYEVGNRRYNEIVRVVASDTDVVRLVDVEQVFRAADRPLAELLLEDELHLSPAGHDLYVATLLPVVLEELAQVASA